MAFVLADRVKETTTTTGTGTITLAGASTGYQSFSAVGNGNSTYYAIAGQTTSEWEVGIGTYTSAGTTLSRTTVLASSNGGSLVTFSAGTKDVFVTYPAGRSVNVDSTNTVVSVPQLSATSISDSGNLTFTGTGNRITGDFSNVTASNRVIFQTSTASSNTRIGMMPSVASGGTAGPVLYSTNDPNNASVFDIRITDGVQASLQSTFNGTGTYLPMAFYTGGSERMRLDTSGNVGIGTSSPSAKLDITGSGGVISKFQNFAGSSGIDSYVAEGTSAAPTALISGRQIMNYRSYGYDGASYIFVGGIDMQAESAFSVGTNPTYLRFRTSPSSGTGTERMRIDSSGKLLVGTSSVLGAAADAVQILQSGSPGIAIGTSTTPTSNASIAGINAYGNDGSTYVVGGTINFRAAENWSTTNHGTDMQFRVTASGSGGALAEAMRIASTGYVGIGTSAPTVPLNVVSSSAVTAGQPSIILQGSNNTERLGIRSTSASVFITQFANGTLASPTAVTTDNFLGGYQFGGYAATLWTRGAQLAGYAAGTWTDTSTPAYIVFQTVPSGSTGLLERMRIDSSGNVGIGTSSPGGKLAVNGGTSTSQIRWEVNNAAFTQEVSTNAAAAAYVYKSNDASYHVWKLSSSEAMRLDSSGNVGIGTSSPGGKLDVSSSTQNIVVSRSTGSYGAFQRIAPTGQQTYDFYTINGVEVARITGDPSYLAFSTGSAATERMRIDSSGNVGIGTSSPAGKLEVSGGRSWFTANSELYSIAFRYSSSTGVMYMGATNSVSTPSIQFSNSGGTALATIDYSGNLGIGTSSPGAKLDVAGNIRLSSGSPVVQFNNGGPQIYVTTANTLQFSINSGSSEAMRIDSSGNVGIGTSAPVYRLSVAGANNTGIASFSGNNNGVLPGSDGDGTLVIGGNYAAGSAEVDYFHNNSTYKGTIGGHRFLQRTGASTSRDLMWLTENQTTFYTAGTERMRINSSGQVGIGTSAPTGQLDVRTAAGVVAQSNLYTGSNAAVVKFNIGQVGTIDWDIGLNATAGNFYIGGLGGSMAEAYKIVRTGTSIDYQTWNTGGSERMRIDSSGNVGIGTNSPDYQLDVSGTSTSTTTLGVGISVENLSTTTNTRAGIVFRNYDNYGASIWSPRTGSTAGALVFGTNASGSTAETNIVERVRIDYSGNLLVGATSASGAERLRVEGSVNNQIARFVNNNASPYGLLIQYASGVDPNGTSNEFIYCSSNSTTLRFSLRSNGGIANYSANNINLSDRREKTNFSPSKSYLDVICAIPVQTFNYIDQNLEEDPGLTLGVIAQDVQAVAPEMVTESNWGTKDNPKMRLSIYQTDLQYALMKCIQEQQALITSLIARIEALEAR